jgi:hypothetical protein
MFRQRTEYERIALMYDFMTSGKYFSYKKDLGNIFEVSSDSINLKFLNIVKVRRTRKYINGKEILLLNVTPCGYVNLEGKNKFNIITVLQRLFDQILFGFEVGTYNEEVDGSNILNRNSKYHIGRNEYTESEEEWRKRSNRMYDHIKEMSKGLLNKFAFFFVGDDTQMVKPLDFNGYLYFLARCVNDIESMSCRLYTMDKYKQRLEIYFGSDVLDIHDKYKEYLEIANTLGVQAKIEDNGCCYNSLEEIQKNEKSRIYAYLEVVKYFFKNGMKFSDDDIKNINSRTYNIRSIYSALGGKPCIKNGEEKEMIAYFTALRCTQDDLPLLINTENEIAMDVLRRRFDLSR